MRAKARKVFGFQINIVDLLNDIDGGGVQLEQIERENFVLRTTKVIYSQLKLCYLEI